MPRHTQTHSQSNRQSYSRIITIESLFSRHIITRSNQPFWSLLKWIELLLPVKRNAILPLISPSKDKKSPPKSSLWQEKLFKYIGTTFLQNYLRHTTIHRTHQTKPNQTHSQSKHQYYYYRILVIQIAQK